ncbi:MAG: autotransporter-associated beta strand repeat-containing protein, partial [Thermoguttaceae bacterium]
GTGPVLWTSTAAIGFAGGSGPRTLTLQGTNSGANTLALALSDSGGPTSLVMDGPGTWLLTAANSYTGPTTLAGGTLVVPTLAIGGVPSAIGASSNSPANLVFNGGTLQYTGTGAISDRGFTLNAGGGTFDIEGQTLTLTGSATGSGGLTKAGPGGLVLTGAVNYGGPTMVNGGNLTLSINNNNSATTVNGGTLTLLSIDVNANNAITINAGGVVQSAGTLKLIANGSAAAACVQGNGTLALTSTSSSAATPDISFNDNDVDNSTANYGTSINTPIDLGASQRYIWGRTNHNGLGQYGLTNTDCMFNGPISGAGGLTFIAQDSFTTGSHPMETPFALNAANTFTGPVEIQRGSVYLGNANALVMNNVLTLDPAAGNNARFFLYGNNASVSNLSSSGGGSAVIADGNANPSRIGPATLTVTENKATTYSGAIVDTQKEYGSESGTLDTSLSLVKTGLAALILAGSDTYSGGTGVDAGALIISNGNALPNNTSLTIGAGASFIFDPAAASSAPIVSAQSAVAAVPEPSTIVLLVVGAMLGGIAWRRTSIRRS